MYWQGAHTHAHTYYWILSDIIVLILIIFVALHIITIDQGLNALFQIGRLKMKTLKKK